MRLFSQDQDFKKFLPSVQNTVNKEHEMLVGNTRLQRSVSSILKLSLHSILQPRQSLSSFAIEKSYLQSMLLSQPIML